MINFFNNLSVVLPKTDNDNKSLDWEKVLIEVANQFGGYTLSDCEGGWYHEGKLYKDYSHMLKISFMKIGRDEQNVLRYTLNSLFETQIAVFVTVNGRDVIVEKKDVEELLTHLAEI